MPAASRAKSGPPPCGEYQMLLGCTGGRSTSPVLRGDSFRGRAQSYQPSGTVMSGRFRSRYGWLLPMQYGQPRLPALVMTAAVSYLAGPQVVFGLPASGPTQPASSQLVSGSTASRVGLRTPIT